jgi:isopenicillin N synthase-like dioxygenase
MKIPVLDLSLASDPKDRTKLLSQLHDAIFNVGFLYIINHGVSQEIISKLEVLTPKLFDIPSKSKASLSQLKSPHFLGYSGFAEETTQGKPDLREQFDYATELPFIWNPNAKEELGRNFSKPYWRLRGPNQWPTELEVPDFQSTLLEYHDAVANLSYRFVHLVEEAFGIPVGSFDHFFHSTSKDSKKEETNPAYLPPQHRIKLVKYPPSSTGTQGVGPHKDSSGWLTLLYQLHDQPGLEVLSSSNEWIPATPLPGSFVVNFGNAFEAATDGAIRATIHRVQAPVERERYSIVFFQGLPLEMRVSEMRYLMPVSVKALRKREKGDIEKEISVFLDTRWDELGESVLRKWMRSHKEVGEKWYGEDVFKYYTE